MDVRAVPGEGEPVRRLTAAQQRQGQLPLRDQAHGGHQRVAGEQFLRAGVQIAQRDAGDARLAVHLRHRAAQAHRDVKGLDALPAVARQTAQRGALLDERRDLAAQQGEAAGHDHADVPAAEDHDAPPDVVAAEVDEGLGLPGGEYARGARPGDVQRADGLLPRAAAEQAARKGDALQPGAGGEQGRPVVGEGEDRRAEPQPDGGRVGEHGGVARGVLRPAQVLAEAVQAETAVDALGQNAADALGAVNKQNARGPGARRAQRRRHAGGPRANDQNVTAFHTAPPSRGRPCRPPPRPRPAPPPEAPARAACRSRPGSAPCPRRCAASRRPA